MLDIWRNCFNELMEQSVVYTTQKAAIPALTAASDPQA